MIKAAFLSLRLALLVTVTLSEPTNREGGCRVYQAPSTIANAGLGIFAGIDFRPEDLLLFGPGDIAVPVEHIQFHTGSHLNYSVASSVHYIWNDYTWEASVAQGIDFDYEGRTERLPGQVLGESVQMASFGEAATANCKFGFINIFSNDLVGDTAGLDRYSPGHGAFTPYHGRQWRASETIRAGSELFVYYGSAYFDHRDYLMHVPQERDYQKAHVVTKKMGKLQLSLGDEIPQGLMLDLFEVVKSIWDGDSRVINALPKIDGIQGDDANVTLKRLILKGPRNLEERKSKRNISWLEQNGQCIDGLRSGISAIPDAGRGAFATRYFPEGSKIAPVPLLHTVDKNILNMYSPMGFDSSRRDVAKPIHKGLLLNYCFGHKNSTMLLSPYGSATSLLNHGPLTAANARMEWADEWMTHPEWLNMSVDMLKTKHFTGLGWNLIALRDIQPNEEVLLDYGPEWESAWERHKQKWQAGKEFFTGTYFPYVPATELNDNIEQVLTEAITSNTDYSYMAHGVTLYCYDHFYGEKQQEGNFVGQECRPVMKHRNTGDEKLFTAEMIRWIQLGTAGEMKWELKIDKILFGVPASSFHFEDIPYNSAHRKPWSFRHEMMIPDDMFPEAWKNI